jgi:hypothetical protein
MSPRAINAAGELSEAGWQAQVIALARLYGWLVYHAPDNRPAGRTGRPQRLAAPEGRGFPDLVLVRRHRIVFAELKTRTGRLGPGQAEWLEALDTVGDAIRATVEADAHPGPPDPDEPDVAAYLWRPADLDDVHRILGRGQDRATL